MHAGEMSRVPKRGQNPHDSKTKFGNTKMMNGFEKKTIIKKNDQKMTYK